MKKLIRKTLRMIFGLLPVRGRHRVADMLGELLDSGKIEIVRIGEVLFPIDHSVEWERYMYYNLYESEFIAHLKRNLKEGDIFIDPGANIGYISAIASGLVGSTGKVFSIEPSPTCFSKLKNYLPQAGNITLINAAVSDKDGEATFYDTPRVITRGFATLGEVSQPKDGTPFKVQTVTVDELSRKYNLDRIKYLKLDIEGSELLALQGSREMLKNKRIDFVLIETSFNDQKPEKIINNYSALLESGYKPYKPTKKGFLVPVDLSEPRSSRIDIIWTHQPIY